MRQAVPVSDERRVCLGVVVLGTVSTRFREVGVGEGASLTLGKRRVPAASQLQATYLL